MDEEEEIKENVEKKRLELYNKLIDKGSEVVKSYLEMSMSKIRLLMLFSFFNFWYYRSFDISRNCIGRNVRIFCRYFSWVFACVYFTTIRILEPHIVIERLNN